LKIFPLKFKLQFVHLFLKIYLRKVMSKRRSLQSNHTTNVHLWIMSLIRLVHDIKCVFNDIVWKIRFLTKRKYSNDDDKILWLGLYSSDNATHKNVTNQPPYHSIPLFLQYDGYLRHERTKYVTFLFPPSPYYIREVNVKRLCAVCYTRILCRNVKLVLK
jgi:hypothetical protein